VLPEIFGSAAIILGAYAWRMERDENRNRGLLLIILGIVAMLVGIYYTSYFGLYNILP
jgi:membrane-bound ClpP family serine protease